MFLYLFGMTSVQGIEWTCGALVRTRPEEVVGGGLLRVVSCVMVADAAAKTEVGLGAEVLEGAGRREVVLGWLQEEWVWVLTIGNVVRDCKLHGAVEVSDWLGGINITSDGQRITWAKMHFRDEALTWFMIFRESVAFSQGTYDSLIESIRAHFSSSGALECFEAEFFSIAQMSSVQRYNAQFGRIAYLLPTETYNTAVVLARYRCGLAPAIRSALANANSTEQITDLRRAMDLAVSHDITNRQDLHPFFMQTTQNHTNPGRTFQSFDTPADTMDIAVIAALPGVVYINPRQWAVLL